MFAKHRALLDANHANGDHYAITRANISVFIPKSGWKGGGGGEPSKKYALRDFYLFFFFSAGFLRHPSRYVSTNACYRDRNDERARPRVRIGRASQRFWKIKFIAFVWPRTTTPRNGLSARKCEKYYVVARRFRHNFYDAAPAQRVGEYDDAEEGGGGKGEGEGNLNVLL